MRVVCKNSKFSMRVAHHTCENSVKPSIRENGKSQRKKIKIPKIKRLPYTNPSRLAPSSPPMDCLSGLRHRWICTFHRRRWRICSCVGRIHAAAAAAAGAHAYRHCATRRHRAPRPLPPARDRCRPTARAHCRICAGEGQGGRHCRRSQTHTRCHRRRRRAHQAWQLPPLVPTIGTRWERRLGEKVEEAGVRSNGGEEE